MSAFETQEMNEWETTEMEFGQAESVGEHGETNEWGSSETEGFLGGLLSSVLGGETGESESPLNEVQEMEAAAELLEVTNEAELEQFLGNLFKKVASGVGGFMKSSTGKALGGILKNIAKKALPVVGGALGSFVAPGVGTALGSKLGSMASGLFEVELEGLNEQEAEFEVARRYVRLASTAARNAATAPRSAPPQAVARAAVVSAARKHAPGLVRGTAYQSRGPGGAQTGRRPQNRRPRPGSGGRGYSYGYGGYPGDQQPTGDYGYQPDAGDQQSDGLGGYDGQDGRGARRHSGRWIRRGHKIVILGA